MMNAVRNSVLFYFLLFLTVYIGLASSILTGSLIEAGAQLFQ
jgi:hypothetical protein